MIYWDFTRALHWRVELLSTATALFVGAVIAESASDSIPAADSMGKDTPALLRTSLQQPSYSSIERNFYWSTWWAYHASFVADFTTTAMIMDRGGREGDPLYTLFGERNMAGVIGSAVVFHVVFTVISYSLYRKSGTRHGIRRFLLYATATGINSYFFTVHSYATIGNIKLYNRLSR
jgi:hypothetical protein